MDEQAGGTQPVADVLAMRAGMSEQARSLPSVTTTCANHFVGEVPMRLYMPQTVPQRNQTSVPLLVFLHGGGWMLGDLETHDACCRWLAKTSACAVLAVAYRLAPEHPFPAGLDDVLQAFRWARASADALGCDPNRVAIGGESAGANLAAAATLALRTAGEPQPLFQLLVHPPTDLRLEQPSIDEVELPGLTRQMLELCIASYAGGHALDDPLVSPLHSAELVGLAPAIVVTVELDPLRDDGEAYALALARAGNEVCLRRLLGLPHGFMFKPVTDPEIAAAFSLLGELVARYFRQP